MNLLRFYFTLFILFSTYQSISQEYANPNYYLIDDLVLEKVSSNEISLIDSCLVLFHKSKSDTSKLNIINSIVEASWDENIWPKYNDWIYSRVKLLLKNKNNAQISHHLKKSYAMCLNNKGYYFQRQGENSKALSFYQQCVKIKKELNDEIGLADTYNNIGSIHNLQGDISKALNYYNKSLKIYEEIGDKRGIAYAYNNLAFIYQNQGELETSLEYNLKSLKIKEEINDKQGMSSSYNNIGFLYKTQGDNKTAIMFYNKSLNLQKEIGDRDAIANAYNNIGFIHDNLGENSTALQFYEKSLKINLEIKDKQGMANSYNNIGNVYIKLGNIKEAEKYALKSLQLSREIGYPNEIETASRLLSEIYKSQGKGLLALKMYKTFITMRDSIENAKNTRAAIKQNLHYNYAKMAFTDSIESAQTIKIKNTEIKAKELINKQQKNQQLYLFGIIFLMILLAGFTYNRFKITNKQKIIITKQKLFVERAHNEIRDSINYAERIQRCFLATDTLLENNLQEHFVIFKPKDVVSGDFYWAGKLSNGNFAIVNADSTGHGVPGAIMSILNVSSIEKAIDKGYTKPADIFNDTRQTIITKLKNDGSENGGRDGMDASILCFDFDNLKMYYCAAKNPIWIIRNNDFIIIKPEKMPLGKHNNDHIPFIGGEFQLQKGDQIYTLTDGFQDQFGGPKGKKFMIKRMRQFILENSDLSLKNQKNELESVFNNWKGANEQVDDICVIGIKI